MDSPQRRVRVVIVDDDALVRAALRLILESDSGVTVLGEGSDGRSGYDAARSLRPTSSSWTCTCPAPTASGPQPRSRRLP